MQAGLGIIPDFTVNDPSVFPRIEKTIQNLE
jgi:hypothetical protein